jgi:AhpD family alkylhydroperoxidase
VYEGDALSRKTKELIAVAASSVTRCPHCTDGHLKQAQEEGASEEEIAEALAVAWGQGGGTQVFWMKDDFADLLGENWRTDYLAETGRAFWDFKSSIFESETLPRVTKELIAVAVSTMLRCRHCTRSHIEAALDEVASRAAAAQRSSGIRTVSRSTCTVTARREWNGSSNDETPTGRGGPAGVVEEGQKKTPSRSQTGKELSLHLVGTVAKSTPVNR